MSGFLDEHCQSPFWDWSVVWDTDVPNLTDCFQKTVLVWIPCGFLWLCLPFEIYCVNKHKKRSIPWKRLNRIKIVLSIMLSLLALADLIYWICARAWTDVAAVNYYSTVIKTFSFIFTVFLILYHRLQGRRSSGVLFIFWLLLSFSSTFTLYSYISTWSSYENSLFTVTCNIMLYPMIILQLILSAISDNLLPAESLEEKNQCPIKNAPLLSRCFFIWFDKMCYLGFRRPLTKDDIWHLLDQYRCSYVFPKFQKNWQKLNQTQSQIGKTLAIVFALGKTFWKPFVLTGLVQFAANATDFVTPTTLRLLIEFVSSNEPNWHGYFYCFFTLFVQVLSCLFYSQVYWISGKMKIQSRAALISQIYRKALQINSNVKNSSSTGEVVNLMSTDVEQLIGVLSTLHNFWIGFLQIALCFYLLWNELGPSAFASIATFLILMPANSYISRRLQKMYIGQMKFKDQRVKLMNEILAGIKVLKLYAWENSFGSQLRVVRNNELKLLKKSAYFSAILRFIFGNLPVLVALSTFITYLLIDENNVLDAKKVFVSISLINIIQFPLIVLPIDIVSMIQAYVSAKRMTKFLNQEELDPSAVYRLNKSKKVISIKNGTFAWNSESDPVLKDINFFCDENILLAILGPVGSGKSSLISAVLGEMEKKDGYVTIKNGNIAYVAQQAWIQNLTLRENILFGLPFNEHRYEQVIEACALKPDLQILSAGDQTEIGERGINLSGGQKQRVSLARAVYSNADIILLDDPLSAVDSHVGKHIFDHVIGPNGLLKNKTRLFITNSIAHLQQVNAIVMVNEGQISEMRSYENLLNDEEPFAKFLINYLTENDSTAIVRINKGIAPLASVESDSSVIKNPEPTSPVITSLTSLNGDISAPLGLRHRLARSLSQESYKSLTTLTQEKSQPEKLGILIEEEEAAIGQVQWQIYMKYFRAVGLNLTLLWVTAIVLATACGVAANKWLSIWTEDPPTTNMDIRIQKLSVYGAFGLSQVTLLLFGFLTLAKGSNRASRILHNSMLVNILRCPLSFFDTTPVGRILNRFSKDMDVVDGSLAQNFYPMLDTCLEAIAVVVVITMSTPFVFLIIILIGILYFFVQRYFIATSRQLQRLESISHSPIFSHFSETLFGTNTIRAYNKTQQFILQNEKLVDEYNQHVYSVIAADVWSAVRLQLLGTFVFFFAALFAVNAKDDIDPGTMGLTVTYASKMVYILIVFVLTACELEANIVSVERISEYTNIASEAPNVIVGKAVSADWPQEGIIRFNNYETKYRDGLDLVLKGINCEIHKEEKIGIVGRTGAGKSSMALALFRIIEPTSGNIIIDNIDTIQIGLFDLRSKLTIIPQDPVLFSGTLRINLDPFETFSDSDVWQALEHSHLKSFVSSLPDGLLHQVNEGGKNMSMGQRQLVCLARALLRKSKVLVLDEATAAVDLETDDLIQTTIRKEFADCTVITIAHRLNTIMDSTRIMVLDQGIIREFDSPANLLSDINSAFYSLAKDAGLV